MRFLGTRTKQNIFRAKLGLVTHENGPMGFFGSRAILEVLRQKLNSRLRWRLFFDLMLKLNSFQH